MLQNNNNTTCQGGKLPSYVLFPKQDKSNPVHYDSLVSVVGALLDRAIKQHLIIKQQTHSCSARVKRTNYKGDERVTASNVKAAFDSMGHQGFLITFLSKGKDSANWSHAAHKGRRFRSIIPAPPRHCSSSSGLCLRLNNVGCFIHDRPALLHKVNRVVHTMLNSVCNSKPNEAVSGCMQQDLDCLATRADTW